MIGRALDFLGRRHPYLTAAIVFAWAWHEATRPTSPWYVRALGRLSDALDRWADHLDAVNRRLHAG